MKSFKQLVLSALLILGILIPSIFAQEKNQLRHALVIGNSDYKIGRLFNTKNDAQDMAAALERLGFNVDLQINSSRSEMRQAIRKFGDKLKKGGVGLFYFAGHGMQVNGVNYLIPILSDIEAAYEVQDEALDAGTVLRMMESAGNSLNIVILDACRNNPFARSFRSTQKGLAQMDAPKGSLIVYATAPGSVADDGPDRNGIFTGNLLKHIEQPNLEIGQMLRKVRADVIKATEDKQIPWDSSSLTGQFYFAGKGNTAPSGKQSTNYQVKSSSTYRESAASGNEKPSIAVLPFTNMSGDPEQEYIADGFSENIITALSYIPELFVIARNSSFTYKNKPVNIKQVGRELGVKYVLEGSIQKMGNRIRVTAQLIDAIKGHHLWAKKYDRDMADFFNLMDEISKKIAVALQVKLTLGDLGRDYGCTSNIEAWGYMSKANALIITLKKEDNAKARELLEQALKLDPNYVCANVVIGWTHLYDFRFGWSESRTNSFELAEQFAEKSIALDNSKPGVHNLFGTTFLFKKQYDKSLASYKKAEELNPNIVNTYGLKALTLHYAGRFDEAIASMKKAIRLHPFYPPNYLHLLARSYRMSGRYEEAITTSQLLLERAKKGKYKPLHPLILLAELNIEIGLEQKASEYAAEVLKINPKFSLKNWQKMHSYKSPADLERRLITLRKAGLPD